MHAIEEVNKKCLENCCLVIPSFNPTIVLLEMIDRLHKTGFTNIVVINDGSSPNSAEIFSGVGGLGVHLITHRKKLGKGSALKSGFDYCIEKNFSIVITLDANGQHLPDDVLSVAKASLQRADPALVLGVRQFTGSIPVRSKLGNRLTQWIFWKISGVQLMDAQTGLRAFPRPLLKKVLNIQGDSCEYELNVLISLAKMESNIIEIPIGAVNIDGNSSSPLSTLIDSFRIYAVLFRDSLVAISSFGMDIALFSFLLYTSGEIMVSTFLARIFSSSYNFLGNRYFVFRRSGERGLKKQVIGYASLVVVIALVSGLLVEYLSDLVKISPTSCKIAVDLFLYIFSFLMRKVFIFK